MKIAIAGGSGFIGQQLTDLLREKGHEIIILSRKEREHRAQDVSYVRWMGQDTTPEKEMANIDAIVNLAGVSINEGRWTEKRQEQIYNSRMQATDELLRIMRTLPEKPSIFVNASAVGIYPTSQEAVYTEKSTDQPDDFLGRTVLDWENKAKQAEQYGSRTAFMRFGIVLGKEAGALPLMTLPYRLFAGGTIGSGNQWVSWVHITDVARAIVFAIENEDISGPVNVTAPNPLRMKTVGKTIGSVLKRPHWFPVPSFVMKAVLGQKSKLVLEGQRVESRVLQENGFEFAYPQLDDALENIYAE